MLQGAQLVQLGVVAVVDHAAIAQQRRRFGQQGTLQQLGATRRRLQLLRQLGQQGQQGARGVGGGIGAVGQIARLGRGGGWGHWLGLGRGRGRAGLQRLRQRRRAVQRLRQPDQLAWPHLAQRQPRRDALHVGGPGQCLAQRLLQALAQQPNGLQALLRRRARPLGLQQPAPQQPAAHAGLAGVEQGEQRRAGFAAQGLCELQVAPRAGGQVDQFLGSRHAQRGHVRQRPPLGVLGVVQ